MESLFRHAYGLSNALVAPPEPAGTRLALAGASAMVPLLTQIVQGYRRLHPEAQLTVTGGSSYHAMLQVREGAADIGMVTSALGPAEQDLYSFPIARDGVALVVHDSNPVAQLSDQELRAILTGQVYNWRELGGPDRAIEVLGAARHAGVRILVARHLRLHPDQFRARLTVDSGADRLRALAGNRGALVYAPLGLTDRMAGAGLPLRALPVAGVAAHTANVRNGHYPIARIMSLVSKVPPTALARSFFAYCLSAQVRAMLGGFDLLPYLD